MRFPELKRIGSEVNDVVGRECRRVRGSVHVRRKRSSHARQRTETLRGRGSSREHRRTVVRADFTAHKVIATEHVVGDVVGIRPDGKLRIIGKVGEGVRVSVIGARRVAGGRDRQAFLVGRRRNRKLRKDPTVGPPVVFDDGIAVVVGLASAAETAPEGVARDRSVKHGSAPIENREVRVDDLHVVVRTDVSVRVRRRAIDRERPLGPAEGLSDSFEVLARRGDRERPVPGLRDRVGGAPSLRRRQPARLGSLVRRPRRARSRPNLAKRRRDIVLGGRPHSGGLR
jgi:hypothetical protein